VTEFRVQASARSYPVRVQAGLTAALPTLLEDLGSATQTVVVTDANVAELRLEPLRAALGELPVHPVPPGEGSKSPGGLEGVWGFLRDSGCDRRSRILALGGGVVGDLAGFAGATYMRGVEVVHLPTTLLSMVDSAIGGKTAINLGAKNLVGAFHAPAAVFADLDALASLPAREVRCGLGEVWKTAILAGGDLFERVERDATALAGLDAAALAPVVLGCLRHKAGVVERDEREAGERALLNLGHTLGHALEVLTPALSHGEAVAVGGAFALRLAEAHGWLPAAEAGRCLAVARGLGLPVTPAEPVDADAALGLMARDKKAEGGQLRWVLPRGIGDCAVADDVPADLVRELLNGFQA
jgi:3-dehydroquinate synthase